MSKALLIIGATGHMGGSVIDALISSPDNPFTILALTRDISRPAAKAIESKASSIKLLQGDLTQPSDIFKDAEVLLDATSPIWGVFLVQNPIAGGSSPKIEEDQAKALIDLCIHKGVKHFVYGSADRHGDRSDEDPTYVPSFASKFRIEKHLRDEVGKTGETGMTYTILRPVPFMENFSAGFQGKVSLTVWKVTFRLDQPLQLVAVKDIGYFAMYAFMDPTGEEYKNKAISLGGDELSFQQARQVFKDKMGVELPTTWSILAYLLLAFMKEIRLMFRFFSTEQCVADIEHCRKLRPELLTFGEWVQKESGWAKK
jgi:uncharacterized protein YbjT (DUF2867 family)